MSEGIMDVLNLVDEDWVVIDAAEIPRELVIPLSVIGRSTAYLGELEVPKFVAKKYDLRVIREEE